MGRVMVLSEVDVKSYFKSATLRFRDEHMHTFFNKFVANIKTSVSGLKL